MDLKLQSSRKDGYVEKNIYACPCGKGRIVEEQDYTPGHRDCIAFLECSYCSKHYYIDFGTSETKWKLVHDYTTYYKKGNNMA